MRQKLKALLIMFSCTALVAMIGVMQQSKVGGSSAVGGASDMDAPPPPPPPPPAGSSVGPSGAIQAADGTGGFLNANNCFIVDGQIECGLTYSSTRNIVSGSKSCPLGPDSNYWNVDVSSWPADGIASTYAGAYDTGNPVWSAATWSSGTVTVTVNTTVNVSEGGAYPISGVTPAGYNSNGATIAYFTVHVIDSTHFSYSLSSNPGAYVSGGVLDINVLTLGPVPSMTLNIATNSTATPPISFTTAGSENDSGPYPWLPTFLVESYPQVQVSTITSNPDGIDNHVLTVNMDTCTLYETFQLINGASNPVQTANGAIFNLRSNNLRSQHKVMWYGNDSAGVTSADVSGDWIWPGVLTHAEVFSGQPITHMVRVTLPHRARFNTSPPFINNDNGFVWPAIHGTGNATAPDHPPLGSRWILSPSFDTTTCHYADCAGLAWPAYMKRILTQLQHYGMFFADFGAQRANVTCDSDPAWGDGSNGTDFGNVASFMHGIKWSDGYVVDPTQHVVNVLSGATR